MATEMHWRKPTVGMMFAFKDTAARPFYGVPARVVSVWPRFRSGDYLVTLEYATPVRLRNENISHIDAFVSELEPVPASRAVGS